MQQRHLVGALGLAIAALAVGLATAAPGPRAPDTDRVLVKFKHGSKAHVQQVLKAAGARFHHSFDKLDTLAVSVPVQAIAALKLNANVVRVEVDAPRYPMGQVAPWGIARVQAPEAVAAGADGNGIKVCVIDSGINANHEEFAGIALSGDASTGQTWSDDTCGHGTHVAGTIAAANNGVGVVGVSPGKVALHIVKVFDGPRCGWSYSSDVISAAEKCQEAGAKIINMSLGGPGSSIAERDAFARLYQEGVLSIAAAGNDGNAGYSYPASYDSVISVAALDANNTRAAFSQYNAQVELAAPGVDVLSTVPFRDSALSVAGDSYVTSAIVGTLQGVANAPLVNGGSCAAAGAWAGKVVLCERGGNSFADKVNNVTAGGGVASVIHNNVPGGFTGTLGGGSSVIPALTISQQDGQLLIASGLGQPANVSTIFEAGASAYGYKNGTSMASPHVAGVAALAWSAAPLKSNQQLREALAVTALDLGAAGLDANTGWGLVQAKAAAEELANGGLPEPGTTPGQLMVFGTRVKSKLQVSLMWTRGSATVDVYRNGVKVQAGIANTLSANDTPKLSGSGTLIYQVCNAASSQCSSKASLYY